MIERGGEGGEEGTIGKRREGGREGGGARRKRYKRREGRGTLTWFSSEYPCAVGDFKAPGGSAYSGTCC